MLAVLAQRNGRVVSKRELMSLVWPTTVVEEANLRVNMSGIRKELGPDLIATIPGRGYQFTALIDGPGSHPSLPNEHNTAQVAPAQPTKAAHRLIGRDALLEHIRTQLNTHRLLTLTGTSGSGKTALAKAVLLAETDAAGAAPVAAHWVDLAALNDGDLLEATMAQACEVTLGEPGGVKALVGALRASHALVILDNAEHLLDAVAAASHQLLAGCPNLRLLVTSQARLKLSGEMVVVVPPLDAAQVGTPVGEAEGWPAQALFLRHCVQAGRPLQVDQRSIDLVSDICLRLDGVPLAIEYAAAAVPLLGLLGVASALEQRRLAWSAGRRDAPERHRTLRTALEWSVSLLGPFEQLVFRRLGVFAGSFSMALLDPVVNLEREDPWRLMEALSELLDRSLVVAEDGTTPRYRLLESTRAFAIAQLNERDEATNMRARHAAALERLFGSTRASALGGQSGIDDAVDLLQPEIGNARAAMQWAVEHDGKLAMSLAAGLVFVLWRSGGIGEAGRHLVVTSALAEASPADALRCGWIREAIVHWTYYDNPRASQWIAVAEAAYRQTGNVCGLIETLAQKANSIAYVQGDTQALGGVLDEIRALDSPEMPNRLRVFCASVIVLVAHRLGRDADVRWVERLAATLPPGDEHGRMSLVCRLMGIQIAAGRAREAIELGEPLYEQLRHGRYRRALHWLPINLVQAHLHIDDVARALAIASDCFELDAVGGLLHGWADALAQMACLGGLYEQAAQSNGYADRSYKATGGSRGDVEDHFKQASQLCAQERMGQTAYERAYERGTQWSEDNMRAAGSQLLASLRSQIDAQALS